MAQLHNLSALYKCTKLIKLKCLKLSLKEKQSLRVFNVDWKGIEFLRVGVATEKERAPRVCLSLMSRYYRYDRPLDVEPCRRFLFG